MGHNETKNVVLTNIDKISVIWIDDIIDEPISKFTEKVKDTITFIWFIHIFSGNVVYIFFKHIFAKIMTKKIRQMFTHIFIICI